MVSGDQQEFHYYLSGCNYTDNRRVKFTISIWLQKLTYTLADVRVLATFMLHVCDAPIIHATHVITYSLKQESQVCWSCKTSSDEGDETTPWQRANTMSTTEKIAL